VKVAVPLVPVVPVTVTVYGSCAPEATVNDPDSAPPVIMQSGLEMRPLGVDVIAQGPLSPGSAKFEPEIRTGVPAGPEIGTRLIVAPTVNMAVPKSLAGAPEGLVWVCPTTFTVLSPRVARSSILSEPVTDPPRIVHVGAGEVSTTSAPSIVQL
jgi:hypothetical protein